MNEAPIVGVCQWRNTTAEPHDQRDDQHAGAGPVSVQQRQPGSEHAGAGTVGVLGHEGGQTRRRRDPIRQPAMQRADDRLVLAHRMAIWTVAEHKRHASTARRLTPRREPSAVSARPIASSDRS